MKQHFLFSFLVLAMGLLGSCSGSKEELIIGKWQEISLEKPFLDEKVNFQQQFIDSFGKNNGDETNLATYGLTNVDSLRSVLQLHLDSVKMLKQLTIDSTQYEFRKDKIVVVRFGSIPDSANWYFDDNGALVLDDSKIKGGGEKTVMGLLKLSRDTLKLQYIEGIDTSVATFIRDKK